MQAHSSSGNAINRFGRGVVVAVVAGAAAWVYSWQTSLHAQAGTIPLVPTAGVTPPLTIVTVNDGPDYQLDPHVSGDLVSYLDGIAPPTLRYFRFSNGSDTEIPRGDSNGDLLSDVSGTRISFTRYRPDRTATMLFDTSTLTTTEILPSERSNRLGTAIGGDTVAFVDYGIGSFVGDIVAYDIVSGTSQLLSNSAEHEDYPQVAPDGSAIVWARCVTVDRLCDVLAAFRAQGVASWTTRTGSIAGMRTGASLLQLWRRPFRAA